MPDPVRLGLVGFGVRGTEIAKTLATNQQARIVAVADVYAGRRTRAAELIGGSVTTTTDFRQVVSSPAVDAVVVAAPDHAHAAVARAALDAEKDVYCEAPVVHLGHDSTSLRRAARARVFQVGAALGSAPTLAKTRELLAAGRLGRVTAVRATWDSASALDAWQRPFPPDASPDTIDFAAFLGAAPKREFDLHRFFRWPCYWDYGSGLSGTRVVPLITAIQLTLGVKAPVRGSLTGGRWRWKDGREVPDALAGTFEFEEGIVATVSVTQNGGSGREIRFVGTEATAVVSDTSLTLVSTPHDEPYTSVGETWAKDYRDWFYMMHGLSPQGTPRREFPRPAEAETIATAADPGGLATHLAAFVASVQTREPAAESLSVGLAVADAVASATVALRQRARLARP